MKEATSNSVLLFLRHIRCSIFKSLLFVSQWFYEKFQKLLTRGSKTCYKVEDNLKVVSESEHLTVMRHRQELQLLLAELTDRDLELDEMVAAHRHQINAWEDDRKKLIQLELQSIRLETEMKRRNQLLCLLLQHFKLSENRLKNKASALKITQDKVFEAEKAVNYSSAIQQELQSKNDMLNKSLHEMASHVERLETREQNAIAQLQIKDSKLTEAESEISELKLRAGRLEVELHQFNQAAAPSYSDLEEKRKFRQYKAEFDSIANELSAMTHEVVSLRKELSKEQEKNKELYEKLHLSAEEKKRLSKIVKSQKFKLDRVDIELFQLKQLYERQQGELSSLQLTLTNSQEILAKQEEKLNIINVTQLDLDGIVNYNVIDEEVSKLSCEEAKDEDIFHPCSEEPDTKDMFTSSFDCNTYSSNIFQPCIATTVRY